MPAPTYAPGSRRRDDGAVGPPSGRLRRPSPVGRWPSGWWPELDFSSRASLRASHRTRRCRHSKRSRRHGPCRRARPQPVAPRPPHSPRRRHGCPAELGRAALTASPSISASTTCQPSPMRRPQPRGRCRVPPPSRSPPARPSCWSFPVSCVAHSNWSLSPPAKGSLHLRCRGSTSSPLGRREPIRARHLRPELASPPQRPEFQRQCESRNLRSVKGPHSNLASPARRIRVAERGRRRSGQPWQRTPTTTSSSARARRGACWPTGCPPTRRRACCCWRPAARTTTTGSISPSATST